MEPNQKSALLMEKTAQSILKAFLNNSTMEWVYLPIRKKGKVPSSVCQLQSENAKAWVRKVK
jgi:hypothetical protein